METIVITTENIRSVEKEIIEAEEEPYNYEEDPCRYAFWEVFPKVDYNGGFIEVCSLSYVDLLGIEKYY